MNSSDPISAPSSGSTSTFTATRTGSCGIGHPKLVPPPVKLLTRSRSLVLAVEKHRQAESMDSSLGRAVSPPCTCPLGGLSWQAVSASEALLSKREQVRVEEFEVAPTATLRVLRLRSACFGRRFRAGNDPCQHRLRRCAGKRGQRQCMCFCGRSVRGLRQ